MNVRFSAVTTIRGRDRIKTQRLAEQKIAAVPKGKDLVAFHTKIPRTDEHLYMILTDGDARRYHRFRDQQSPSLNRVVNKIVTPRTSRERLEFTLTHLIEEEAVMQFFARNPERDVLGNPHQRLDTNRYMLPPGSLPVKVMEKLRSLLSHAPFVPKGGFDFDRDLKNPIHIYEPETEEEAVLA